MDSVRTGLRLFAIATVTLVAVTTTNIVHARKLTRADVGLRQQSIGAAQTARATLLDQFEGYFKQVAATGQAGFESMQSAFSEMMGTARQMLADKRIDQAFFDRYARMLRVTLLAAFPDKGDILQPVIRAEAVRFIRDATGKNVDGPNPIGLGELSKALEVEIGNLRKLSTVEVSKLVNVRFNRP